MKNKCPTRYCSVCYRSSRPEVFCIKDVLRNFPKFTGQACNFIKKEALPQVFSCEFCEISNNTFFTEHLRWLLLLLDEIQNTKKMKIRELKERKFEKKVREIG